MSDPVDDFITRVRAAGISRVILAGQREWDLTDGRGFGPVSRMRLLAYAGGELIAAEPPGDRVDHPALLARLRAAGLEVEERSRNRG